MLIVTPGQSGDAPALPALLAELKVRRQGPGRPRTTPEALRGDKAYSSRAIRGGRPVAFDIEDYKNRNVVERTFNQLKQWRGLATRYDKHAITYRGGMVLAAIVLWLRA